MFGINAQSINAAFVKLGGDPTQAIADANAFASVDDWINAQIAWTAAGGAGLSAIPFAHLFTGAADLVLVIHKMAWTTWGVGHLSGVQIDADADLQGVLALWSGAVSEDGLRSAGRTAGAVLGASATSAFGYWVVAHGYAPKLVGLAAGAAAQEAARVFGIPNAYAISSLVQRVVEEFSKKLGKKLATKIAAKLK